MGDVVWEEEIEGSRNRELSCEANEDPLDVANANEQLVCWRERAKVEMGYHEARIHVVEKTIRTHPDLPGKLKFTALVVARNM